MRIYEDLVGIYGVMRIKWFQLGKGCESVKEKSTMLVVKVMR